MFPFSRYHPAHTQCVIFFVSSTGRQAQSLAVDSIRGCLFSRFYSHVSGCFSFLPARRPFSLSYLYTLSRILSLSRLSFDTLHVTRVEEIHARRYVLEQFLENISSLPFLLALSSRSIRGPRCNGGWKFTRHGFRSSFAPRSYGSRRSLERMARIVIFRLDISTRYSVRAEGNFSFRESIRRFDNALFLSRYPRETFHARAHTPTNRSHSRKVSNRDGLT